MRETRRSSARGISDDADIRPVVGGAALLPFDRPARVRTEAGSETITADQIDIGKVQARIQKYD
jgi:hypothetical protein